MRRVLRSGCALLLALALASCGPSRTLDPDSTAPVRLGLVISLTGDLGSAGQARLNAVELAVREVNAAGGVLPGRRVELVRRDGGSVPATAAAHAAEIVADDRTGPRVVGMIGDSGSSSTLRIYQEVTAPAHILHASGSSTSPLLNELPRDLSEDGWFFRTVPSDDAQAPVLARTMADRGCSRVAVVHLSNDYGVPFEAQLRSEFQRQGLEHAGSIPIADGLADYSEAAAAVEEMAAECVAIIAYPGSGGRVLRAWASAPTRPATTWFGADALRQSGFVAEIGDTRGLSIYGTAPVTDPATPAYNAFRAAYQTMYASAPSTYAANFYDAAALMLLSIVAAGEADSEAMRAMLPRLSDPTATVVRASQLAEGMRRLRAGETINYEGASGPVNVDERGEIQGVFEVWRVMDGAFVRDELLYPE